MTLPTLLCWLLCTLCCRAAASEDGIFAVAGAGDSTAGAVSGSVPRSMPGSVSSSVAGAVSNSPKGSESAGAGAVPQSGVAERGKSGIILYRAAEPTEEEWAWIASLRQALQEGGRLEPYAELRQTVILPQRPGMEAWAPGGVLLHAAAHGVGGTPALVIADSAGSVYAVRHGAPVTGGHERAIDGLLAILRQPPPGERLGQLSQAGAEEILDLLRHVPVTVWASDYPQAFQVLAESHCDDPLFLQAGYVAERLRTQRDIAGLLAESFGAETPQDLQHNIAAWQQFLHIGGKLSVEHRQQIMLCVLHPLYVRLSKELMLPGGHTPESTRAFLDAVTVLEQAKQLAPNSRYGMQAHRMREELRKARLAAAKYD